MTMDCDAVARLMDRWGRGGEIDDPEALAAAGHVDSCPRCTAAYGALVPLLQRDARASAGGVGELAAGLAEAIMDRIARDPGPARAAASRRLRPALALAAAALVVLGVAGVLLLRTRSDLPGRLLTVTFVLEAPEARSVAVVGDFNDWRSEGYELARRGGDGAWTITLRLRREATYTYGFLVDGREWVPDPRAHETVDDGFGGVDSVLRL